MIAAHGLAYLLVHRHLVLTFRFWLLIQLAATLAILPWLGRYLDHSTDYPMPRYSLRFLLGVPIEYIGGNSLVLLACLAIIGSGWLSRRIRRWPARHRHPEPGREPHPDHLGRGAARPDVCLFPTCPSDLRSVAVSPFLRTGLPDPAGARPRSASRLASLAVRGGRTGVFAVAPPRTTAPSPKADWRALSTWLNQEQRQTPNDPIAVVVHPSDPRFPREQLEAARYYLSPRFRVAGRAKSRTERKAPTTTYDVYCRTRTIDEIPATAQRVPRDYCTKKGVDEDDLSEITW